MCWLAIGFLLIICIFLMGRSYQEILYQEENGYLYLEGKIADKQYKDSDYGAYWQITLKRVRVFKEELNKDSTGNTTYSQKQKKKQKNQLKNLQTN